MLRILRYILYLLCTTHREGSNKIKIPKEDYERRYYPPRVPPPGSTKERIIGENDDPFLASPVNSCEDTLYQVNGWVAFAFIIAAFCAFVPIHYVRNGINGGLDALRNGRDMFDHSGNGSLAAVHNMSTVGNISAQVASGEQNETLKDRLNSFSADANFTLVQFRDIINSSQDIRMRINTVVYHGQYAIDHYSHITGNSYIGFLAFTMILYLLSLYPKSYCSCCFRYGTAPLAVCHVFCLWALTGLVLFVGIVASDFCMKPNWNTLNTFEAFAGQGKNTTNSVQYYLNCIKNNETVTADDGKHLCACYYTFLYW